MLAILIIVGGGAFLIGISVGSDSNSKPKAKVLAQQISPSSTTTSTSSASTSETTDTSAPKVNGVDPQASTTTTAKPATHTTAAPSPTTTIVCKNSYDKRCGSFFWSPAPAPADHTSMTFKISPTAPKAGDDVSFAVHVSEPNTVVGPCSKIEFGDGLGIACSGPSAPTSCPTRYGAWTPPAKQPHETDDSFVHRFDKPGTYTVTVENPLGTHCYDPWEGTVKGSITVTVS
jgi:plastocyanin